MCIRDSISPILAERARAGVEVRILCDGMGGRFMPKKKWEELKPVSYTHLDVYKRQEQDMAGENTEDYLPYRTNSVLISELAEYLTSFGIVPETMKVESVSVLEEQETTEAGYHIHRADIHVEALGTMEELYRLLDWAYDRDWISVTTYSCLLYTSHTVHTQGISRCKVYHGSFGFLHVGVPDCICISFCAGVSAGSNGGMVRNVY